MPGDDAFLRISPTLAIPRREFLFRASRAGGPGGQHVNRSSTRIELWWDVARSPCLTEAQRALLLERLGTRLDATGRLRLVSGAHRSQARNRAAVTERLARVLAAALHVAPPRKRTRPSAASIERRLDAKRRRSRRKLDRRQDGDE